MMLDHNNLEVADVIINWIDQHVKCEEGSPSEAEAGQTTAPDPGGNACLR
jgi:hypothetical protein